MQRFSKIISDSKGNYLEIQSKRPDANEIERCSVAHKKVKILRIQLNGPRAGPGVEKARRPPSCEVNKNLTE